MSFLASLAAPLLGKLLGQHGTTGAVSTAQTLFTAQMDGDLISQLQHQQQINHRHAQFVARMDADTEQVSEANLLREFKLQIDSADLKQTRKLLDQV